MKTKLSDKRSARIAALKIAAQLLWKEYGAPTLAVETVDIDATREAIIDLHDELCRKLARSEGFNERRVILEDSADPDE